MSFLKQPVSGVQIVASLQTPSPPLPSGKIGEWAIFPEGRGGGACNLYTGYSDSGVWPEKKIWRGRSIFRGRWGKPKTRRKTSRGGGGGEKRTNHRTRTQALLVVRDSVLSPVHQSCSSRKREKRNSFPNVLPINQSMSFLPFQPDTAPFSKSVKGV